MSVLALLFAGLAGAYGKSFLHSEGNASVDAVSFRDEIQRALEGAQGCGGDREGRPGLGEIQDRLLPVWRSLPKNAQGRIDRSMLRYITHRYFMRKSAIVVRGFEEARPPRGSEWAAADLLSERLPRYVESVLTSERADSHGFTLEDVAKTVAILEELIFDSETRLLEKAAYQDHRRYPGEVLTRKDLQRVLESYLIRWILGSEPERFLARLTRQSEQMFDLVPRWREILDFADGQIRSLDYRRQRRAGASRMDAGNALLGYTMADAHEVVGGITASFASFWESECQAMKMTLVGLDKHRTGRVPLSTFHSDEYKNNFAESTGYLRQLGALDETSRWSGPQVVIPNYIQGGSNCLISTPHYLVCCMNSCEALQGEIEQAFSAPAAAPGDLLAVVANMSEQTTVDHDWLADTRGALASQLEQIAEAHGGQVPLHGRLFAQWLHYVFPRECPFPHKAGTTVKANPVDYGEGYLASGSERIANIAAAEAALGSAADAAEYGGAWMSQWDAEEELVTDYGAPASGPWGRPLAVLGAGLLGLVALAGATAGPSAQAVSHGAPECCRSHFV